MWSQAKAGYYLHKLANKTKEAGRPSCNRGRLKLLTCKVLDQNWIVLDVGGIHVANWQDAQTTCRSGATVNGSSFLQCPAPHAYCVLGEQLWRSKHERYLESSSSMPMETPSDIEQAHCTNTKSGREAFRHETSIITRCGQ
jgi:hypothetical protein